VAVARRRHSPGGLDSPWAYAFIAPAVLILGLFTFYPAAWAFAVSLQDYNPFAQSGTFIGLTNYRHALASPIFWHALGNMAYYAAIFIPGTLLLAFTLALVLNQAIRGRNLFRVVFYLPFVISVVAASLLFRWIYLQPNGLLIELLQAVHLPLGANGILGDPLLAMPAIAVMNIWRHTGYYAVIFLAALQGLSPELYEAGAVDGATGWAKLRRLTLPLLRPVLGLVVALLLINVMHVFVEVFEMTGGGPANSTLTVPFLIYRAAFSDINFGLSAAFSFLLFVLVLALIALQMRTLGRDLRG
jgi:multiple sugar transport system permease protein